MTTMRTIAATGATPTPWDRRPLAVSLVLAAVLVLAV